MIDTANKIKIAVCLSDGTKIKGTVNLHIYKRLSDFLNSENSDPFLIVSTACMDESTVEVVIINRDHIVWAVPEC